MKTKTYYEILNIPETATTNEIKRAYYTLCKKYHPDINHSKTAEAIFKQIQEAFETLSDPLKRKKYDTQLHYEKEEETVYTDYQTNTNYEYEDNNEDYEEDTYNTSFFSFLYEDLNKPNHIINIMENKFGKYKYTDGIQLLWQNKNLFILSLYSLTYFIITFCILINRISKKFHKTIIPKQNFKDPYMQWYKESLEENKLGKYTFFSTVLFTVGFCKATYYVCKITWYIIRILWKYVLIPLLIVLSLFILSGSKKK